MPPFLKMNPGESLDQFHDRCVVPTAEETDSRNQDIDGFVRFLQSEYNSAPYTVASVIKSGSLGKGTAVRDSADIDLVVILNGLSSISDLKKQRPLLLSRLKDQVSRYSRWREKPEFLRNTGYSLRYSLNGQELDILPALDIVRVYGSKEKVYQEMTSNTDVQKRMDMAQEFSASMAPLQIDFVKPEGEAVKRVIRLLKLWKNERNVGLRSYTLELLTICTAKTVQWSNTATLFRNVLSRLTSCESLKVAFDRHYDSSSYTRHHGNHYVLDPANPNKDTMQGVRADRVSKEALDMLHRL